MSNLELYTSQTNVFGGIQKPFEKAEYVILGVPFDATSTYRSGASLDQPLFVKPL